MVNYSHLIGRAIIGRAIIGRVIIGRAIIGRAIIGRAIIGRAMIGRAIIGRAIIVDERCEHVIMTQDTYSLFLVRDYICGGPSSGVKSPSGPFLPPPP